jgi:arsenite-transporting ATPase
VQVPLRPFDTVGVGALRQLLSDAGPRPSPQPAPAEVHADSFGHLVDQLAEAGRGSSWWMGKGGVGKTTLAAALAVGLRGRPHGAPEHHRPGRPPGRHHAGACCPAWDVSRIDPKAETARYIEKIVAPARPAWTNSNVSFAGADLASPCTEEVAGLHAFSAMQVSRRAAPSWCWTPPPPATPCC